MSHGVRVHKLIILCSLRTSYPQSSWLPELEYRDGEQNELLHRRGFSSGGNSQQPAAHLDKSMGPDGIHLRLLGVADRSDCQAAFIIYQQSWSAREVPDNWRLANEMLIYNKCQKKDSGNYRPVSLNSVLRKVMEQIISNAIT